MFVACEDGSEKLVLFLGTIFSGVTRHSPCRW